MIIENPRRYTYKEMEKEFDGQCVCVVEIEKDDRGWLSEGLVIVSDPSMDVVFDESQILEDKGLYSDSTWSFENFTNFGDFVNSGIVEVIPLEDD